MPLICDECGTANREKAKFCTGCAARLGAIEPSGLATIEPARARPSVAGTADRLLPAEKPGFWLRLIVLGVAMTIGFMTWYLYVTQKVPAPSVRHEMAMAAPVAPAVPAVPDAPKAAATAPVPDPATPAAAPAARAAAAEQPARAQDSARPAPRRVAAETRRSATTPRSVAQDESSDEPSVASVQRTLDMARQLNRSGPPIAVATNGPSAGASRTDADAGSSPVVVNPGPRYGAAHTTRFEDDPGPPVAVGPGPLYEGSSRATPRTPSRLRDDPGPPIAVGPGPLVDYSARAVRSSR